MSWTVPLVVTDCEATATGPLASRVMVSSPSGSSAWTITDRLSPARTEVAVLTLPLGSSFGSTFQVAAAVASRPARSAAVTE